MTHTNQTNTTMKTKLDDKLEINAQFEVLDSSPNVSMPVHVQSRNELTNVVKSGINSLTNVFNSLTNVFNEPNSLKDFFPTDQNAVQKLEAMEQEKIAKGRASMSEDVKRAIRTMPYFYCD